MLCVAGIFVAIALFDLPSLLPGIAHTAILAGFALAFAGAAIWGCARWSGRTGSPPAAASRSIAASPIVRWPRSPTGRARRSTPRPRRLWEAHRQRMTAMVRGLRVGWPAAGFARRDPWGLRAVLAIFLVLGGIDAGGDWRERLARAFSPGWEGGPPPATASFDIWITPPDYTGLPPQFLRADTAGPISVPTGSKLLAQIHGGSGVPRLSIDAEASDFQAIDKENFRTEAVLTKGQLLSVTQSGATLGKWPIEIIPDNPPVAVFAQPPRGTTRAALRLEYRATDDYGVEAVKAVIRRQGGEAGRQAGGKARNPIAVAGPPSQGRARDELSGFVAASLGRAARRDPARRHRRDRPDR